MFVPVIKRLENELNIHLHLLLSLGTGAAIPRLHDLICHEVSSTDSVTMNSQIPSARPCACARERVTSLRNVQDTCAEVPQDTIMMSSTS